MAKSSPSPPPAPDPTQTAQAQSQSNIQTAIANARLNRVSQTTPWGSINYTQGPADASGVPSYSANIQLSPQQQALLDQQQGMQRQRGDIAQSLLGRVGSNLSEPLNLSNLAPVNNRGQMYRGAISAQPQRASQPPPPSGPPPGQQPGGDPQMQQLMGLLSSLPPDFLQQLLSGADAQGAANPLTPGAAPPGAQPAPAAPPSAQGDPFNSYQQYLQYVNARNAASKGIGDGSGQEPMNEGVWNDPERKKWDLLGNMIDLNPGDPRYDEVKQAILAAHPGSDVRSVALSTTRGGADKSKTVRLPDGTYAWSVDNSTQPKESDDWKMAAAGIATVLSAGALGGAMGWGAEAGLGAEAGAGLGAGEAGAFDAAGSQGVFDAYGNPLYTSPTPGTTAGAFDMNGSQGVFDSSGNPQYQSPRGGFLRNMAQGNTPWSGNGYNPFTSGTTGDRASMMARVLPALLRLMGSQQRRGQ